MIEISKIRHPREKLYGSIIHILGALIWLLTFFGIITLGITGILTATVYAGFLLVYWLIIENIFRAIIFGNAIHLNPKQHPEIYKMLEEQALKLGIKNIPDAFILSGNGLLNAFAVRILHKKYVLLLSEVVDLYLERNEKEELKMIIGHELGHHALGHLDPLWRFLRALIEPGKMFVIGFLMFYMGAIMVAIKQDPTISSTGINMPEQMMMLIPVGTGLMFAAFFIQFLYKAYERACELSCDRVGYSLIQQLAPAQKSLMSIAGGSRILSSEASIESFKEQEKSIPIFFAFLYEIFSNYPRMTKRIIEIEKFSLQK